MHVSDRFVNFLASWEGERLTAYKVPGEQFFTIGVGHTGLVRGRRITATTKITREESRTLLKKDLERFEAAVRAHVPYRWRRRRRIFETCVSMAFNMGEEILTPEPPLESFGKVLQLQFNPRNVNKAVAAIKLYNKGGSPLRVMAGLTRRRKAEAHLFKYGQYLHNE